MAYHDYTLSKDEFLAIFPQNASAEHVGDMFEFWLGMLELGIQVPTMFRNWGESLDNCLVGLEESFLLKLMQAWRHLEHEEESIQESPRPADRERGGCKGVGRGWDLQIAGTISHHPNAATAKS